MVHMTNREQILKNAKKVKKFDSSIAYKGDANTPMTC